MHAQEGRQLGLIEGQELGEGLGEHIVVADVKPWLAAHFVFVVLRLRQVAETAVRYLAQFVVVIKDHAPVPGDAEVLQQEVAGEDVRIGEVADGLSVIDHRALRRIGGAPVADRD